MRLIDADALKSALESNPSDFYDYDELIPLIDAQPTISPDDVRGVGKWEKETTCYSRCSNCKKLIKTAELVEYKAPDGQGNFLVVPSIEEYGFNYCPNCGARMMEVTSDAE